MTRTARLIRRSVRAALAAGRALVTAARGAAYRLHVRLYAAIDAGETVRIAYTDSKGVGSVRDITPERLWISNEGNVNVRAYDHRDGDVANFRTDRIQLAA